MADLFLQIGDEGRTLLRDVGRLLCLEGEERLPPLQLLHLDLQVLDAVQPLLRHHLSGAETER